MRILQRLLDGSETLLVAACVASFVAMFVLGVATVVFRFVLESSLAFPDELIRYLFVWMIALGSAVTYRRNAHAAIGALVDLLPDRWRKGALLIATGAGLVFFAIVLVYGALITLRVWPQISPALEVSMSWVYAAAPAGMAFLAIYAVELLARQIFTPAATLREDDL